MRVGQATLLLLKLFFNAPLLQLLALVLVGYLCPIFPRDEPAASESLDVPE